MEVDEYSHLQEDTMEYSDPLQNYCRLKTTAVFLQTGGRVTEDWMEEHKKHIMKYFDMFPRFGEINEDITDHEFRKKAKETETLLCYLVDSIQKTRTFNTNVYRMLNEHMIYLCETIFSEDELNECMQMLNL